MSNTTAYTEENPLRIGDVSIWVDEEGELSIERDFVYDLDFVYLDLEQVEELYTQLPVLIQQLKEAKE